MSKTTLATIACLGAGGGAAVTAAVYALRGGKQEPKIAAAPAPTTSVNSMAALPAPTVSSGALPANQVFGPPAVVPPNAPLDPNALVNPAGLFEYGFPGPVADVGNRSALISSYDRRLRNPHWVVEHITPASLAHREGDRKHSAFLEDDSVPQKFRALLKDYFRSGYDRGHQVGEGFNRDYWAHFEDFCRRLTVKYPSVRIVTGPLYLPKKEADGKWYVKYEMIGSPPSVAVPTHFYKVIFAEDGRVGGNVALGAFVLPNAPIANSKPITDFEVPLEAVERASGLEFATKLPPQRRRRLCTDTTCALVIRDFADKQKAFPKK
ncbi:hypothetical protein CEP52_009549 [Fusarium oligoseptatum]|uniref:Endonuclease n=1 Tax=Fusarium oligoseptatum TaxID=2604345 RepID=A0A428TCK4_9HYPO|nr:hypothetical protein CEP52_009549 [Fusarium oligoseptatum]